MSLIIVATAIPLAEHRDEVIAAFEDTITRVHAEDEGCELYALHTGRDRVVMIEKWTSKENLASHGRGPALADLQVRLAGKLESEMDVRVLRPHPAGTESQGVL
jgi:quinol monooxygenase YgiN